MRYRRTQLLLPFLLVFTHGQANEQFLGHWAIEVRTGESPLPTRYELTIEQSDSGFLGFIYNGPVNVSIEDDAITVEIDWIAGNDTPYVSELRGTLSDNDTIEGIYDHFGRLSFTGRLMQNGIFAGRRIEAASADKLVPDLPPDPVDISGVWNAAGGFGGFSKENYATTPAADAIRANFNVMDAPHIRCAGYGLVTTANWMGTILPVEIFQNDEQVTFVLGADFVRRIYLDDREYPRNRELTDMGFSKGQWQGSTLEVITTHIKPSFMRAGHGNPVSENAHTREYFYLDQDGYLHRDLWLHDPENYVRPPYMPRVFDKSFQANVISKMGCDPYSYFRQLHLENELEEFFGRSEFRR